jgi:hypothetical protein
MTAFLTITETLSAGKAGHVAASTNGYTGRTLTRIVDANINAGLGVVDGATPGSTCKAPSSANEAKRLLGILIDPEFKNDTNAAADFLSANADQAGILEEGYIWVTAEATVAVGDDVYVRHSSDGGSNTTAGTFRPDSDTPSGGILITPTASPVAANGVYSVVLRTKSGVQERFAVFTDGTANENEIATALKNQINNSANFDAVDNTGSLNVTVQGGGAGQVEVVELSEHLTLTTGNRAERVLGAEFVTAVTGAGLAKVRLRGNQKQHKVA